MQDWQNLHRTLHRQIADYRTPLFPPETPVDPVARLAALARIYGAIITDRQAANLLVLGTSWSFSALLGGSGTTIATDSLGLMHRLPAALAAPSPDNPGGAQVLVSGATKIRDLNLALEGAHGPDDLSLRTTGSYDGQSVAGMLGTGVHGSVVDYGPFQNQIRGLHLVTGPDRSVWIEAGPTPILDPAIVATIATEPPIYDATVFDSALIHLGGMGIVSAVLLEAVPFYLLDVVKTMKRLTLGDIELLAASDFAGFALGCGENRTPAYVEVVLDPFTPWAGDGEDPLIASIHEAMITFFFVVPASAGGETQLAGAAAKQSLDSMLDGFLGSAAVRALDTLDDDGFNLVPTGLFYPAMALDFRGERGTQRLGWGQANGHYTPRTVADVEVPLHNDSFALERAGLVASLDRIAAAFREGGGGHLVFTLRFVTHAAGTLAFTRFPETVVVNVDGIRTARSHAAARRMLAALETAPPIPFSQHWGKMGDITAARVTREFGDPADPAPSPARHWRETRDRLLDPAMRAVFVNDAITAWGLV